MSKIPSDKSKPKIRVDKNMRDYSNEPAFVQAAERATAFLKKNGLPTFKSAGR